MSYSIKQVHEVSKDMGIPVQTIYKWMKQVENVPRLKSALEKFSLIIKSKTIQIEQYSEWLRKCGHHFIAYIKLSFSWQIIAYELSGDKIKEIYPQSMLKGTGVFSPLKRRAKRA